MRALGSGERLAEEGDAAGGLAAGRRETAVHAPQIGQTGRLDPLARFRRVPQRLGRLAQVVLEQLGLGERAADLDLLFARQTGTPERPGQQRRRISAPPLGEGLNRLSSTGRTYPRRRVYLVYTDCQPTDRGRSGDE